MESDGSQWCNNVNGPGSQSTLACEAKARRGQLVGGAGRGREFARRICEANLQGKARRRQAPSICMGVTRGHVDTPTPAAYRCASSAYPWLIFTSWAVGPRESRPPPPAPSRSCITHLLSARRGLLSCPFARPRDRATRENYRPGIISPSLLSQLQIFFLLNS
jgi:hypothetical protein